MKENKFYKLSEVGIICPIVQQQLQQQHLQQQHHRHQQQLQLQ